MSNRKIDPGEGYYLLDQESILEPEDEFLVGRDWLTTASPGIKTRGQLIYRRKIKPSDLIEVTGDVRVGDTMKGNGQEWPVTMVAHEVLTAGDNTLLTQTFEYLGFKFYRKPEPKKTICYPQVMVKDGDPEYICVARFKTDDRIWISNKEPLTFKEE